MRVNTDRKRQSIRKNHNNTHITIGTQGKRSQQSAGQENIIQHYYLKETNKPLSK